MWETYIVKAYFATNRAASDNEFVKVLLFFLLCFIKRLLNIFTHTYTQKFSISHKIETLLIVVIVVAATLLMKKLISEFM